jgi:hypothetical protein
LLQQWFTLCDPLMKEMLIYTPYLRCFAEIEVLEGRIPIATTIKLFNVVSA